MEYEVVVGLEVHAELSTKTKIYCGCKNQFGSEVNTNCCPVCTGMPGTLPKLNEKVVEYAARMGIALNCSVNQICKQDRKNYFYPDLPKAYQISQFDIPLCESGYVNILLDNIVRRIGITRIHIEEDAGKLLHGDAFQGSLVDFNRCGVPLIEIVSEPDMRSAKEAKKYLETIRLILMYLDISDCKMQEGSIRCDVNVSVRQKGSQTLGVRCEMKNVNSFSAAYRAIEFEEKRQIAVLEAGGEIIQETRRWDDMKGESVPLRTKEDAHDYRYFPEPDLSAIVISDDLLDTLKKSIPELPNEKIARYMRDYALPEYDAQLIVEDPQKMKFFEEAVQLGGCKPKSISNWIMGDISKILNEQNIVISELKLTPARLISLIKFVESGKISVTAGKTVLLAMLEEDQEPEQIIEQKGLVQISNESELEELILKVLAQNQKSVEDYKNGKTNALGYLVGQGMRLSEGKGNPQVIRELLTKKIN